MENFLQELSDFIESRDSRVAYEGYQRGVSDQRLDARDKDKLISKLQSEVDELRKDKARLDWLETGTNDFQFDWPDGHYQRVDDQQQRTVREAIDDATGGAVWHSENAANVLADKMRIDWLETARIGDIEPKAAFPDAHWRIWDADGEGCPIGKGNTLRDAIDAAMGKQESELIEASANKLTCGCNCGSCAAGIHRCSGGCAKQPVQ